MEGTSLIRALAAVYSWLSDDISKEIFLAKLTYSIAGNKESIDSIVKKYLPDIPLKNDQEIKDLLDLMPKDSRIVLYGAGEDLFMHIDEFVHDSRIIAICDVDKEKQKKGMYGFSVISPEQLLKMTDCYVIITSHLAMKEIEQYLSEHDFPDERVFEMAPYVFCADNGQYFSPEFLQYEEENGEIFIDAGCCNLQSTIIFGDYCKKIRKVYAFEPDERNFERCIEEKAKRKLDFVELIKCGTWSKTGSVSFSSTNDGESHITESGNDVIDVTAIDDVVDPDERITFIKMDVEGAELESLKGATGCIKRDRPKLAICIYHKPEDLYEIPMLVKALVPEYRLYIRHHSNMSGETVLYAVI